MLFYIPLERYEWRYTKQWSAPITGWLERNWVKHKVNYIRVDSPWGPETLAEDMKTGYVLDAHRRTLHATYQTSELIKMAEDGKLGSDDVIFFDDFWHPAFAMLPYTFHLLGIRPRMYAFCHAQSVDEYDFTYEMRYWMRHFEQGIAECLTGIFVNNGLLAEYLVAGGVTTEDKIHVTGHVFSEEEVLERMPEGFKERKRENKVVFSSRWDTEKRPRFFLAVAEQLITSGCNAKFVVCSGQKKLNSNDRNLLIDLAAYRKIYPDQVILKTGLTKEEYYAELASAKIQFNCSLQDWISFVLLEASVAGCWPVYPKFRSFPEALQKQPDYLYTPNNVAEAAWLIQHILYKPDEMWTEEHIERRAWIHRWHNITWARMLRIMQIPFTEEQ